MKARTLLLLAVGVVSCLALASPAQGGSDIFLSTDAANSEATYILQFLTGRKGRIDKIMVSFPGTGVGYDFTQRPPSLGRFLVSGDAGEDVDEEVVAERMTVVSANAVVIDVRGVRNVKAGTMIFVELFNLHNPAPGTYWAQVQTYDRHNRLVETLAPIAYWTYGSSVDTSKLQARVTGTCNTSNSYVRAINADGSVSCQTAYVNPGDITSVNAGRGLIGGATVGDATLSVDFSAVQARVTGTCGAGTFVSAIDALGGVVCQSDNVGLVSVVAAAGSGLTSMVANGQATLGIATGGVTSVHIQDGTIAAVDVNPNQVQLRVSGTCDPGSSIRSIDNGGGVVCQPDNVGTTVTAGTGLTGATTNGALTLSADFNQVQKRVTGVCASGSSVSQIAADGTVTCQSAGGGSGGVAPGDFNTTTGEEALFANFGSSNTADGAQALWTNNMGSNNTAIGAFALMNNNSGIDNTGVGVNTLGPNFTGNYNTAVGSGAGVATDGLNYSTAVGFGASVGAPFLPVDSFSTALGANASVTGTSSMAMGGGSIGAAASVTGNNSIALGGSVTGTNSMALGVGTAVTTNNTIRLGNRAVSRIEAQVGLTVTSDRTKKENFQSVDGEEVLKKLRTLTVTSWNFIGQDPKEFRHYGPMAQEFYAAFGQDGVGTIGTPTTITSTDIEGILMIAVRALEQRTAELKAREARIKALEYRLDALERELGTFAVPAKFSPKGQ